MKNFLIILLTNLKRNFFRNFFASIGIVIGIGSLYFFITVGTGLNSLITSKTMQKLPVNMLRVRTTELSLGIFRFGQPSFMKSATISEEAIESFKAIPGVRKVYPIMNVMFPISAVISFSSILPGARYRRGYRTDLIMSGAPETLIKNDIRLKNVSFSRKSWPIPVLISRHILDIYNSGFASAQNLPKLSEKALLGLRFNLILGQSTLLRERGKKGIRVPCRVVGFTTKSEMLGLVMPLDYVKIYNKRFIAGFKKPRYSSCYVLARSSDKVSKISDTIEKNGYTVHAHKKISNLILLVTFLLGLFSMIIIFIAAVSIFNAFTVIVSQRRMEIGLFRSFGASRRYISALFLSEASIGGTVSGLMGITLGIFLVRLTWSLVKDVLPPVFPSLDVLFPISFFLPFVLLSGSVITSILAAYFPALIASRIDISKAVRK